MQIKDYRALVALVIEGAAIQHARTHEYTINEPSRVLNLIRLELNSSEADKLTQAILDEAEDRHAKARRDKS